MSSLAGPLIWGLIFSTAFVWSAIDPYDRPTWVLETLPAVIAAALLLITRTRFPLTPLLYVLILLHCIILLVGGHYTYARVPMPEWLPEFLTEGRNQYDKLGHLAQGFVPAVLSREILLRHRVVNGAWLVLFVISICLAFSAFYELLEWWVAELQGEGAEAFLGTQGYEWDTQSDMFMALVGSILALLTLSRWHDRQLEGLARR